MLTRPTETSLGSLFGSRETLGNWKNKVDLRQRPASNSSYVDVHFSDFLIM